MIQRTSRKNAAHWMTGLGVTFLGYVAVALPSVAWLHRVSDPAHISTSASVVLPWLAPGVGVICLRRYGLAVWPATFLASILIWAVVQSANLPLTVAESASDALGIVVIVELLRVWGFHATFDRYQDPLILLGAVAVGRAVSSFVDALWIIGNAWVTADPDLARYLHDIGVTRDGSHLVIDSALLDFTGRWWLNAVSGCVLLVPLFSPPALPSRTARVGGVQELIGLLFFVAVWTALAYRGALPAAQPLLVVGGILLVSWAALRFSVRAASLLTLVLSAFAIYGLSLGVGVFAAVSAGDRVAVTWGFIALLSGTSLFLTALLAQRNRLRDETARSAALYERLFSGYPFPMWVEEVATGRITIANPAALRFYGYPESEFIGFHAARLLKPGGDRVPAGTAACDAPVSAEEHLDAAGRRLDVEVTRVAAALDGKPVRVCFAEPQGERNALRLAIIEAGDLERFRLGAALKTELLPILERITRSASLLAGRTDDGRALIEGISVDVNLAIAACRRLTRGASPLLDAGGDLVEALRRLPLALPQSAVKVEVIVGAEHMIDLSPDRADHIYRLAEDAVRRAAAQPGVHHVWITVDADDETLRLRCVDDAVSPDPKAGAGDEDLATRSIAARASAAHGRLECGRTAVGGTIISFECAQSEAIGFGADSEPDSGPSPTSATASSSVPSPPPMTARPLGYQQWLSNATILAFLTFATSSIGAWFLSVAPYFRLTAEPPVPTPWLASGVGIAGLLVGGASLWPGIVVGTAAAWLLFGHSTGFALTADALAEALSCVLVVRLLARLGFRHACDTVRDFGLLVIIGAVGHAIVAAAYILSLQFGESQTLQLLGQHTHSGVVLEQHADSPLAHGFRWWLSGVAGVILVVPASLAWSREALRRVLQASIARVAWLVCFVAVLCAVFYLAAPGWNLLIIATALVVITWASFDLGVAWASSATLVVAISATASFGFGLGALHDASNEVSGAALWGFIALLVLTAQSCNMLLAEGERADSILRSLEAQYRILFEAIPHPLFAFSTRSTRITLANQEAIRQYGYSSDDLLSMTVDELDDEPGYALPRTARPLSGPACHRCRNGEIIDVELTSIPVEIDGEPSMLLHAVNVGQRIELRSQMLEATDRERRRLAQDFHDGLGQALTGLSLGTGPLLRSAQQGRRIDDSNLEFVTMAAGEASRICEELLGGISPLQNLDGDLIEALRRMPFRIPPADRHRLRVEAPESSPLSLPLVHREHLYQIAQEAVNNALKYSGASRIEAVVAVDGGAVSLTVTDNGAGFDPAAARAGLGLDSFRLRGAALGARLSIDSRIGRGTTISCVCPTNDAQIFAMTGS